ncbi:MAG: aminopeptidase [Agathobacter sp.]|nr:aminopeptidase [Agathobacter sp.]
MSYKDLLAEKNEFYKERLELVTERLQEISKVQEVEAPFDEFFKAAAERFLEVIAAYNTEVDKKSTVEKFYAPLKKEAYITSFSNPAYAVKVLGEEYGRYLSYLHSRIDYLLKDAFLNNSEFICLYAELLMEIYYYFENKDELSEKVIKDTIYSFKHDNCEMEMDHKLNSMFNASYGSMGDIVMEADLTNTDYLYQYGLEVSEDAINSAKYLNTLSEEEIQAMADTFTEGYRMGFAANNKDITKNAAVDIRYSLGFERMIRAAVKNFDKMGLKPIFIQLQSAPSNFTITTVNKQYEFDHREDDALWMDKAYAERYIECVRNSFEKFKDISAVYGGPAVCEVFGETPFSPEQKDEKIKYTEEQQELSVYVLNNYTRLVNKYVHIEDRSFTIISYPVASIGDKYKEIFKETVKLNTLDYVLYRDMQKKLIDVLDTADKVHIVGKNDNKTDLYVKIFDLANPDKETAFENCVADVNIPVGEVFTSPVLEGTTGKLHVSQVYLNELNYENIEIDFKDGMIVDYTCTNFEDEEKNRKYIADNVLFHHKTLPLGEFAIGTNTTAYKMARVYDIADKLPILIAEKTGPHFAVGDTCFKNDEDNITYNFDGKAIVARDNSVSALRKTDASKAYFNCHTDITIPYNELGAITVIRKDGSTEDIIKDGRFVVPGTEALNVPLEEYDAIAK